MRDVKRNVEVKAKVADLAAVRALVEPLADGTPLVLEQEDTFFQCPQGRLKLRCLSDSAQGELIFYERPDRAGPKESRYVVHGTGDPRGLREIMAVAFGVRAVVRKRRTLYRVGRTRVHLDEVEGLGDFVELEVVLRAGDSVSEGSATAYDLLDRLGIPRSQLVEKAYVDLLPAS